MINKAIFCGIFLVGAARGSIDHDVQLFAGTLQTMSDGLPAAYSEAPSSVSVQTGTPLPSDVSIPIVLFAQAVANAVAEPVNDTARKHIALGWFDSALRYADSQNRKSLTLSQEEKNFFCAAQRALQPLVKTPYVFYTGYKDTYVAYQNIIDNICKGSADVSLPVATERNVVSNREFLVIMQRQNAAKASDASAVLTIDAFLAKPAHVAETVQPEPVIDEEAEQAARFAKKRQELIQHISNFVSLADEISELRRHDDAKRIELITKLTECLGYLTKWTTPETMHGLKSFWAVKFVAAMNHADKAASYLQGDVRENFYKSYREIKNKSWFFPYESFVDQAKNSAPAESVLDEESIFKPNNTRPYSLKELTSALTDLRNQIDLANEDLQFYGESITTAVSVVTALELFANILKEAPAEDRANFKEQWLKILPAVQQFAMYINKIKTQVYGSGSNSQLEQQKKALVIKKYNEAMQKIQSPEYPI